MSKRTSLVGLCFIMLVFTLAMTMSMGTLSAQDATATPTVPAAVPSPTSAVADIGTGSTHLSFWNGLTGSDGVTLNQMLAQYAQENPDISITTEIIPWLTLYTKLQAAFVAEQAPDVFLIRVAQLKQFESYGVLQDLSSWYTSGGGTLPDADFAQPAFDRVWIDGKAWAVPLDNHGRGAWINVDMFTAAGLDPNVYPTNYEETVALLQKLTLDANGNNAASPNFDPTNVVQWGISPEWLWTDWLSYSWGNGGSLVSEDGKTATINSPENLLALQRMYDLTWVYHVQPPPGGWDPWAAFAAGKAAINPTGTWFRNAAALDTDINSQAWPVLPIGNERSAWIGSHVFVVPASTTGAQLEAVHNMINWVADNEVLWAASGQIPARLSAQSALDPATYPSNILLGQTFQQYGHLEPVCISGLEFEGVIGPELSAALNNQETPQQALDNAQAGIQQVLDRQPC